MKQAPSSSPRSPSMPPIPYSPTPRIVIYYQTQHNPDGTSCSILPILTQPNIAVTHVILAAIHLNDPPGNITLNDHAPHNPRYFTLWAELQILQASGVKVMGMLGGAAKGSFTRLDLDQETFEQYYTPLRNLIRERGLDGLDLDVEEPMTLAGVIRLIDRLKSDFGEDFIITLAPVAAALQSDSPNHNLSGFSYEALEVMRGKQVAWYNTQFYCGWGDLSKTDGFDFMVARGWPAQKIVIGMVTNPGNGSGWVSFEILQEVLITLKERYPEFGGVMGWEYFNSLPGDQDAPWKWAEFMTKNVRRRMPTAPQKPVIQISVAQQVLADKPNPLLLADADVDASESGEAPVPKGFDYYTDGDTEE